ncbi:MAG: M48 family metallopeptidase [Parcubacteria group bacterium]|nr:M48 family metallopeptidase [Parcubacteria group bacterium]
MTVFFGVVIGIGWIFSQIYGNSGILYIAVAFSIFMNVLSYWFSDKIVLKMHKAKPVDLKSHPELYRILENLTIAAGLPMPRFYIIEDPAPNAFATGRNPKNAVVAVTTGLMEKLDRSELEGVLSHELSHIGNRDMLVSTVAVVLVGFIAILSDMFMRSMLFGGIRSRDNDSRAGGILIIVGIALSILAPIITSLIHMAISRKREFLADTSGALLTRYPEGLANALEKISTYQRPMKTASNATAHLFLENPFGADRDNSANRRTPWLVKIFSTHPPIGERIKILKGLKI